MKLVVTINENCSPSILMLTCVKATDGHRFCRSLWLYSY